MTAEHSPRPDHIPPSLPRVLLYDTDIRSYELPTPYSDKTTITRLGFMAHARAIVALDDYLDVTLLQEHPHTIETTPDRRLMELRARDFVENTVGVPSHGDIFWENSDEAARFQAQYETYYETTFIHEQPVSEHLDYIRHMSLLVHELAHSTGHDRRLRLFLSKQADGSLISNSTRAHGAQIHRIEKFDDRRVIDTDSKGEFFEEAFAEETAARWREAFLPDIKENPDVKLLPGDILPLRFFDYDPVERKTGDFQMYYGSPAYAAHALSLLKDTTGTDLYDLLCHMRDPEQKTAAKKAFIQTINSVDAGLYQKLRDLGYSEESFAAGLRLVQQIIETK